jgi:type IV fimbrial biogenesis protein FimT
VIEAVITVSIVAILAMLGVPSFQTQIRSTRLTAYGNSMLASIWLARSEAIKRNARVTLCKSANNLSCTTAGDWAQGGLLFVDSNGNGKREVGELVVKQLKGLAPSWKATGNGPVADYISYLSTGQALQASGSLQMGTLTICKESSESGEAMQIIINSTGRPKTEKTTLKTC